MGYKRRSPFFWTPTALGVADAARSLDVTKRTIEMAIKAEQLKAYVPTWGTRRTLTKGWKPEHRSKIQ